MSKEILALTTAVLAEINREQFFIEKSWIYILDVYQKEEQEAGSLNTVASHCTTKRENVY